MHEYGSLDFTLRSEENFYEAADLESFRDQDADIIYAHLVKQMRLIPFGDYLRRYIYMQAGYDDNFEQIDLREFQTIIVEAFRESGTPPSFTPTTAKLSTLAKNWLTQNSVSRSVIFLLGFGLGMTVADVSTFLVNVQRERDFDFKDPFEIICWYCLKNRLNYHSFNEMWSEYQSLEPADDDDFLSNRTMGIRDNFFNVKDKDTLMEMLRRLKFSKAHRRISVTAKKYFDELYLSAREAVAKQFNLDEEERTKAKVTEYLDRTENSERLSREEKLSAVAKIRNEQRVWAADEITEGDVEKFICCGVPMDSNGNLKKFSASTLAKHFSSKRLSRQHLREINQGKADIDRFDLITLNFFVISQDDSITNNQKRFSAFLDSTNEILNTCAMGELYIANPYECFLLLCSLSDYPLGAYADVLEKSFEEE